MPRRKVMAGEDSELEQEALDGFENPTEASGSGESWQAKFLLLQGQMCDLINAVNSMKAGTQERLPVLSEGAATSARSRVPAPTNEEGLLQPDRNDVTAQVRQGTSPETDFPPVLEAQAILDRFRISANSHEDAPRQNNVSFSAGSFNNSGGTDLPGFAEGDNFMAQSREWSKLTGDLMKGLVPTNFTGEADANPALFVKQLRRFLKLQPVSRQQFILIIYTSLQGRALTWFQRVQDAVLSPEHFLKMFQNEFATEDYVRSLRYNITRTRQKASETIVAYIDRLCRLCEQLPDELPEAEVIDIIQMGLQRQCALHLCHSTFNTVGQLRSKGQRLDALLQLNYKGQETNQPANNNARDQGDQWRGRQDSRAYNGASQLQGRRQEEYNRNREQLGHSHSRWNNDLKCYHCGAPDHFKRECPRLFQGNGQGAGTVTEGIGANQMQ